MSANRKREFGETTLGEVFLYIKDHFINLLKKWWIIALCGFGFAALGYMYAKYQDDEYIAYSSFSAESSSGTGGMMASAMELAGKFGISGSTRSDGGMTVEYLLGIAKSHRIIKSSLLKRGEVEGQNDILANHFMRMYEFYEDEIVPADWKFSHDNLDSITMMEDSILRIIYTMISSDHFTAELPEGQNVNVIKIRSKSKQFSLELCGNIVDRTEAFFMENRTKQDKEAVQIIEGRSDSLADRLFAKEYELAAWRDSRNRVVKAKGYLRELQLMREVEMLNLMYGEVIANLEAAKFNLLQNKPIFAIIDEPRFSLTVERVSPVMTIIIGGFFGGMFGIFLVIGLKVIKDAIAAERALEEFPEPVYE